ncbi:uncharacterized protein LOC108741484 [Agrilus planipennis]|uniref:Uncharacterized protein LOC108741484 n=1 Tax=Agrilus planipennis TaxID=224129 RepID=A0A7F5RG09_AGRPL|nr:uncharacterized protein LOC108741484 [Agrilus planipennis]
MFHVHPYLHANQPLSQLQHHHRYFWWRRCSRADVDGTDEASSTTSSSAHTAHTSMSTKFIKVYRINNYRIRATDFQEAHGHNIEGEKKFVQAENSGKFNEAAGEKKTQTDAAKFSDENFHKQQGGSTVDTGKNTAYKKGHHKAGFHKSYNKDESGSESSFFDDGSDEGGHVYRNNQKGQYGDQAAHQKHGGHLDDRRFENEKENRGAYSKGDMYHKDYDDRKAHDTKKYYDGHEKVEKTGVNDNHALRGDKGYYEEKHIPYTHHHPQVPHVSHDPHVPHVPYHTHDYVRPLPAEKTITIYEDPRVYVKGAAHDRAQGDRSNIKLDIRPPPPAYHYDDPAYDYYY